MDGKIEPKALGKISEAKMPAPLDYGRREASLVPGPGSYDTPDLRDISLPEGGRLSRKPPQERIKIDEYPSPAPGAYGVPADPTVPRQLYGSFGKDPRITKFIQDEVNRSKHTPAPGTHDTLEAMESLNPFCPEGGRYLEQVGRPRSYFDSVAKLQEGNPSPDRYNNMQASVRPNKAAGKLVWKYQSETLESTKKVINRVVGTGDETPAPGHYNVPDPAPLGQVPTLRGRALSHGMPHPYAYNCQPDHSRKFDSPVLGKNSGDQIYGRDLAKGTPGKEGRAARAKALADEVASSQMPLTLAEREIEQPGETVRWQSGGFAALRKAKSSPVIQRQEHPCVEEMSHHYPTLAKRNGRKEKTWIPLAHRRPEIVKCYAKAPDYQTLQKKKWELGEITAGISVAASIAMEPLDVEKLREEATKGLMDKAKFRMRMEGLSEDQQKLVLAELPGVLLEKTSSAAVEEEFPMDSVDALLAQQPDVDGPEFAFAVQPPEPIYAASSSPAGEDGDL